MQLGGAVGCVCGAGRSAVDHPSLLTPSSGQSVGVIHEAFSFWQNNKVTDIKEVCSQQRSKPRPPRRKINLGTYK